MTTTTTTMPAVDDFTALLARGDAAGVVTFFQGMPEKDRHTFSKPLWEFLRTLMWRADSGTLWRDAFDRRERARPALTPAAMAVFPSASATAKFVRGLQKTDVLDSSETAALEQILAERSPAWLTELRAALLAELEPEGAFPLVEAVRGVAKVELEATREFLRAWGVDLRWGDRAEKQKAEILADPRMAESLPLMFDDDDNDDLFTSWSVFRVAAITAVKRGQAPRAAVLDASLRRLLRGGRTGAMQDHVTFWTWLEADDAEIAERASSCISLLSSQNGTVARTFLASLRQASDAGLLDVELAAAAVSLAFT